MSRWVEPRRSGLVAADDQSFASGWTERVVKYVPAEVLVVYTGLMAVLGSLGVAERNQSQLAALLILIFLVVTVVRVRMGAPAEGGVMRAHLVVSPVAFVAWSYSISACLLGSWFRPEAALVLIAVAVGLSLVLIPKAS